VLYLVAAEVLVGLLGIAIAWSPSVLYDGFAPGDRLWGLSPADDQAVAGAILLVVEEPVLLAELAVLFIRALNASEE
jgi:cytochrome c oxidase assembly factor CtaG